MTLDTHAPWHKVSFDRFLQSRLPQLLASRLPLAGYHVESAGRYTSRVRIAVETASGHVETEYTGIPQCDEDGVFEIDGKRRVVLPTASEENLDRAEIRCVGEQLYDYIEQRLGQAPPDLPWDPSLARAWLPLDAWINDFFHGQAAAQVHDAYETFCTQLGLRAFTFRSQATAEALDEQNWLAKRTHLRRIHLADRDRAIAPGEFGRTCPFETPEGPNIGRVLSVALGAEIRDGRLIIVDDRPEAGLGLTASMVPFLEHNDSNRLLMGVNMMRQWIVPPEPEPAYVQTGNEPEAPGFWCGRNLLTAFISWGADTFEDGIVISQSCAGRLDYPHPIEPGDKLSNRHGTKGTVTRILPDDEMPHLADGTPVELIFNFLGCHTRLNFGQIREAVMGRIARAEGSHAIVPPFRAPSKHEIRERLARAGLPESGMETLTAGRKGMKLERPSTVGWVYWGKTCHLARNKIHASIGRGRCNLQGELEYYALRDAGAFENLAETFNTRAERRDDADTLAARLSAGPVTQAGPPTPSFADVTRRLNTAGIRAALRQDKLACRFDQPEAAVLRLARPVPHPWLPDRKLSEVGVFEELAEYGALAEANAKLERIVASGAPQSLSDNALAQLKDRVKRFFDALLTPEHLRLYERNLFSGRTVLSVGADLRIDQVGLPDEIAWTLFGPLLVRELRNEQEVRARSQRATRVLDETMARSWVLLNRAPTIMPTAILAFRPVRHPDRVIRLHPLVCMLMNADFDGDQAAVFLPITEAAQEEAAERLSVPGHLTRDPAMINWLVLPSQPAALTDLINGLAPAQDMIWGLASLSLTPQGLEEISKLAGIDVAPPEGFVTRPCLIDAMRRLLQRDGASATLEALERLMRRGFEVAKGSGASISPFIGKSLDRPPAPAGDEPQAWDAYAGQLAERIAYRTDFADNDLGPQLLAVKSGARGSLRHLACLLGSRGTVIDVHGEPNTIIRHGYNDGLRPDELLAHVVGAREGLGQTVLACARQGHNVREASVTKGFNVLARAMHAAQPGIVFASAAATSETDPLNDLDSRLFVGLPVTRRG